MSGGFSFGSSSTPKTTGMGFGATTATPTFGSPAQNAPNTGVTFGSLAQSAQAFGTPQQQPQATGITFGTPNTQSGLTFGSTTATPATTQAGLSFGAPTSTPQTGFSFGATTTAPLFGSSATFGQTNRNFGVTSTPAAQPQTGGFAFSTPASSAFGAPATSTAFGAPAATTAPAFGAPAAVPTAPVAGAATTTPSFGTPTATFGAPAASTTFGAATTSTFNAPTTSSAFGNPAAPTFATPGTTAQFGVPATTAVGFPAGQTQANFGAPTSTTFSTPATSTAFGSAPSFGAPTTTAFGVSGAPTFGAATAPAFGTAATTAPTGLTTATTTAPSFGLSFGTANTTAAATPLSFGLGTTAASTKPSTLFGLTTPATTGLNFGSTTSSTQSGFGLGTVGGSFNLGLGQAGKGFGTLGLSTTAPTTTTTTTSLGLGGLDPSQNKFGLAGSGSSRNDNKAVKDHQAPNDIVETVDNFKKFLKEQKNLSSDVAHGSAKPLNKVQEETENLKQTLASLQNGIQRSSALVAKLKSDTAKCLQNAEMAQRTHESPSGLQYDNTAPLKYFQDLVANFEHEMKVFKLEINNTEKHLHSLMQPMPLTSQELSLAMRRLHDSFVALAGRLQSVHNSVETEKNQYLLLRKYFLKDSTNVFEEEAKKSILANSKTKSCSKASAGPTPFSALGGQHGFGLLSSSATLSKPSLSSGWSGVQSAQQLQQTSQPLQQVQSQLQQSGFSTPTLSNTLFGGANTSTLTSPQPVENQNFQLQKPPLGNKRGKR